MVNLSDCLFPVESNIFDFGRSRNPARVKSHDPLSASIDIRRYRYVGYSCTYGGQTVRIWVCPPHVEERTLSQMPFWVFLRFGLVRLTGNRFRGHKNMGTEVKRPTKTRYKILGC